MDSQQRTKSIVAGVLGSALLWSYWPVLGEIAGRWSNDPKYSHGYLVPVFALWLLWKRLRREGWHTAWESQAGTWWGLALLLLGLGLHLAGVYIFMSWISELSFLVSLGGLCLTLGGWRLLKVIWPSLGFLAFMLPLPYRLEIALALPLQRVATLASTYLLEMLGFCASAKGNVIVLNNSSLGVVEACSGLGMIVTFVALATGVAIVLNRPLVDRLVVVGSAIPVSLIANIVRITVTGILSETVGGNAVRLVYHDLAGYLMMTFALALIALELKILSYLLVAPPPQGKTVIDLSPGLSLPPIVGNRKNKVPVGK